MTRCALLATVATLFAGAPPNNGVSFVADRYYFEMSYGDGMEFLEQHYLPGSTVWKLHFRSVLRIELAPSGTKYRAFTVPALAQSAAVTPNRSKTLMLATFGEHAIILTPEFHLLKAYSNTSEARWLNDQEIAATVEVGGPRSKYDTGKFAINVITQRVRRLPA